MRADDPDRLSAIERSGLLRHTQHERLNRLCYTATELLDVDAAQINVLTDTQQIYVAEWPRVLRRPTDIRESGCQEVLAAERTVAIDDTRTHPVMCRMPWTATWRGYLGTPLKLDSMVLGTMCALTTHTRAWTDMDRLTLEGIAAMVLPALS